MQKTTTHDCIQRLQQDNQLMCQLSRELICLIKTVPYQQATLELKCLELLACVQQKNGSLVMLLKHFASSDISHHELISQRQRQYQFAQTLSQLIEDWQQQRDMSKLKQHFIPFLEHSLLESQALEEAFYHNIQMDNASNDDDLHAPKGTTCTQNHPTSFVLGHNRHAQNQN